MLLVVHVDIKTLEFFDTFHSSGMEFCEKALDFIEEEMTFTGKDFNRMEWKMISNKKVPRQSDAVR